MAWVSAFLTAPVMPRDHTLSSKTVSLAQWLPTSKDHCNHLGAFEKPRAQATPRPRKPDSAGMAASCQPFPKSPGDPRVQPGLRLLQARSAHASTSLLSLRPRERLGLPAVTQPVSGRRGPGPERSCLLSRRWQVGLGRGEQGLRLRAICGAYTSQILGDSAGCAPGNGYS